MSDDKNKIIEEAVSPLSALKYEMSVYDLLDKQDKLTREDIVEFAKEYQRKTSELSMSYEELAIFGSFFEKYGEKFGVLDEFHENGIC